MNIENGGREVDEKVNAGHHYEAGEDECLVSFFRRLRPVQQQNTIKAFIYRPASSQWGVMIPESFILFGRDRVAARTLLLRNSSPSPGPKWPPGEPAEIKAYLAMSRSTSLHVLLSHSPLRFINLHWWHAKRVNESGRLPG